MRFLMIWKALLSGIQKSDINSEFKKKTSYLERNEKETRKNYQRWLRSEIIGNFCDRKNTRRIRDLRWNKWETFES